MTGVIRTHACVCLMIAFPPLSGKEEAGDEEEDDNGNVALRTINTCSQPLGSLPLPLYVICHQKLNFLLAPVQSFHPVCHRSEKKKSFLITDTWNKEIPQLCMALEVTSFLSSFLSLNLCMSLWFHCSHAAVQRQSYSKQ